MSNDTPYTDTSSDVQTRPQFATDGDQKVPEDKVAGACELLDATLGSALIQLRGALDPDKPYLRKGQTKPTHVIARLVQLMADTDQFFSAQSLPDFLHIGWDEQSRTAFETAVSNGLTLDTKLTAYCFLPKALASDDTDLDQFPGGVTQKARYRTRQNLCIPWFDRYTPLHLDSLLVVRFAGTTDCQDDIGHIRCDDSLITGQYSYDQMQQARTEGHTPSVHVMELTEDDIGDLIKFPQIPDSDGSLTTQTNPDGLDPEAFIEQTTDPQSASSPNGSPQSADTFFQQAATSSDSSPASVDPSRGQPAQSPQTSSDTNPSQSATDSSAASSENSSEGPSETSSENSSQDSPQSSPHDSPTPLEVLQALKEDQTDTDS